jgi:hypothetical protein
MRTAQPVSPIAQHAAISATDLIQQISSQS